MLHLGAPAHLRDKLEINDNMEIVTRETRLQFTSRGYRWKTSKNWNLLPETLRKEKEN